MKNRKKKKTILFVAHETRRQRLEVRWKWGTKIKFPNLLRLVMGCMREQSQQDSDRIHSNVARHTMDEPQPQTMPSNWEGKTKKKKKLERHSVCRMHEKICDTWTDSPVGGYVHLLCIAPLKHMSHPNAERICWKKKSTFRTRLHYYYYYLVWNGIDSCSIYSQNCRDVHIIYYVDFWLFVIESK